MTLRRYFFLIAMVISLGLNVFTYERFDVRDMVLTSFKNWDFIKQRKFQSPFFYEYYFNERFIVNTMNKPSFNDLLSCPELKNVFKDQAFIFCLIARDIDKIDIKDIQFLGNLPCTTFIYTESKDLSSKKMGLPDKIKIIYAPKFFRMISMDKKLYFFLDRAYTKSLAFIPFNSNKANTENYFNLILTRCTEKSF